MAVVTRSNVLRRQIFVRAASSLAGRVRLVDGTLLPCETLGSPSSCQLIWGHGLGPEQPWNMNRRSCESFSLVADAMNAGDDGSETPGFSTVVYDARGHGGSCGWEHSAQNIRQFHWRNLGIDMLFVANHHQLDSPAGCGALLGGYSMGASSALWAAYLSPTSVKGLILLSVTTAWEIRAARRGTLLENARKLESVSLHASGAIRGAAWADLPSLEDLSKADLGMPVLLACARDDATHPSEVIERLDTVLPNTTTCITDSTDELRHIFPGVMRNWVIENFVSPEKHKS